MLIQYFREPLKLLYETTLFPFVSLVFAGALINGGLWALVGAYVYPNVLGSTSFELVFSNVTLVFGLVFSNWITKYMADYSTPMSNFLTTLMKIKEWRDRLIALAAFGDEERELLALAGYFAIRFYGMHRLEYPSETIPRFLPFVKSERIRELIEQHNRNRTESSARNLSYIDQGKVIAYGIIDVRYSDNQARMNHVLEPLKEVAKEAAGLLVAQSVKEPIILHFSMKFFGGLVLLVFWPIHFWISTSLLVSPVMYALSIVVVLAPYLIFTWLGDPFSENRSHDVHDAKKTVSDLVRTIINDIDEEEDDEEIGPFTLSST